MTELIANIKELDENDNVMTAAINLLKKMDPSTLPITLSQGQTYIIITPSIMG